VRPAFEFAENFIIAGSEDEKHAAIVGFLESVQNVASHHKCGSSSFEPFLGPQSKIAWEELNNLWRGKAYLAEVVAMETGASLRPRWWQFWKKRKKPTPAELLNQIQNPDLRKIIEQMTRE
ncbi:MAG: hypothetical protein WBF42_17115, partial [Terracidiphilus sp.]